MSVTERMADFIVETKWADFPALVIERAKKAVLDTVGVTLAGMDELVGRILADFARKMGGAPEASIIGSGARAAHLRGFDAETTRHALGIAASHASGVHANFGTMTKPLHAGLAPEAGLRAAELAAAGLTASTTILEAPRGFLDVYAGGGAPDGEAIIESLGRPYALVEEAGITAADVARIEVSLLEISMQVLRYHAPQTGLEGNLRLETFKDEAVQDPLLQDWMKKIHVTADDMGWRPGMRRPSEVRVFLNVYAGGGAPDGEAIIESLGRPYALVEPGMNMKPYPCCLSTHPAVDALYDLVEEAGITAADVARIEVSLLEISMQVLRYHAPQTGLEGKFSIEYCLARMLLEGNLRLETFKDEAVQDPLLQDWMKKIHVTADDMGWRPGMRRPSEVRVFLNDGRALQKRTDVSRGCALWPLEDEKIRSKFRDCAKTTLAEEEYEEVLARLESFEAQPEIDSLMRLLSGTGERGQTTGRTA